jgi:hypothetical protein
MDLHTMDHAHPDVEKSTTAIDILKWVTEYKKDFPNKPKNVKAPTDKGGGNRRNRKPRVGRKNANKGAEAGRWEAPLAEEAGTAIFLLPDSSESEFGGDKDSISRALQHAGHHFRDDDDFGPAELPHYRLALGWAISPPSRKHQQHQHPRSFTRLSATHIGATRNSPAC